MNLKKYASFFHDGTVVDIKHIKKNVEILMESAEIEPNTISNNIVLINNRIRGTLIIKGIIEIIENGNLLCSKLCMKFPDAEIAHFDIDKNHIELYIIWNTMPPSLKIQGFSSYLIKCKNIYWKN